MDTVRRGSNDSGGYEGVGQTETRGSSLDGQPVNGEMPARTEVILTPNVRQHNNTSHDLEVFHSGTTFLGLYITNMLQYSTHKLRCELVYIIHVYNTDCLYVICAGF